MHCKAVKDNRDTTSVRQVRGGEMPLRGTLRPTQPERDALAKHVETVFDQQDRASKPDPGRVAACRLNLSQYSNSIRDLLAVEFRADGTFPTDDSGDGFDNIADGAQDIAAVDGSTSSPPSASLRRRLAWRSFPTSQEHVGVARIAFECYMLAGSSDAH